MRGRVSRLQLLLVLASTVILGSEHRKTHDHMLLSQIRDSPNLEGQVPVLISHRNMVVQVYLQGSGFSLSSTTRRATVDVFETASTRAQQQLKVKVKVTLRLAVYRQSFRFGAKPLEDHDQGSFFSN
jgi:hypothetical protein